jgi:hypothetical protein
MAGLLPGHFASNGHAQGFTAGRYSPKLCDRYTNLPELVGDGAMQELATD